MSSPITERIDRQYRTPIHSSIDGALAELRQRNCDGSVIASLMEAQRLYREQTVEHVLAEERSTESEQPALAILQALFFDVAAAVRNDHPDPGNCDEVLANARAITDLLQCAGYAHNAELLADDTIHQASWLAYRLVSLAMGEYLGGPRRQEPEGADHE